MAAVLGHSSPEQIDPKRAFKDLGFDSLAAVELRNRLATATGIRLGATVVFDYPSTQKLAEHLLAESTTAPPSRSSSRPRPPMSRSRSSAWPAATPAAVSSPQELWQLIAKGREGIEEFPADRGWDTERLYDPDPDHPGTTYCTRGGFLTDPGHFDAEFFGISPREALAMDPQQRLLLESSWEALESAGIDPSSLRGEQAGVFAGLRSPTTALASPESATRWRATASPVRCTSVASGRIAYSLGLEGPAMTVDTACSSSLVALHLASQALRGGECCFAIGRRRDGAGDPDLFTEFARQRGLSPDGRCRSFSDSADGTGFSEGVGVLVLSRLSDAEREGHPILGLIRGSAVNQDGASNGLTAPNGPSQERVIRQALANARLTPTDIDLVEAHGTGTTLGDPIEAGALLATYGQEREEPLYLGSVKSNIGHTQAAAGVAGVIKALMAMREGVLPKTLHVDQPSSKVDWEAGKIELLTEEKPWGEGDRPRRAAISSFGISGTNAHLILEGAPEPVGEGASGASGEGAPSEAAPLPQIPLALSAKGAEALAAQAERLLAHIHSNPELSLTDLAYSLATTRSAFEHRAVVMGGEREQLLESLGAFAQGKEAPGLLKGIVSTEGAAVFLFAGQGAQHAQMALGLLDRSPAFATHIEECEQALSPFVDWSLAEVLRDPKGKWLDRLDVVQPALFAVMVSLARLWQESGVSPAAVIGHSQGEIAAAHIAGALSLTDAARVVSLRARAMTKIAGRGAMLSLSLTPEQLGERIEPYADRLSLAAINGPASLVISGEPEALAELRASCEKDGIRAQPIAVDYAAHSAQIEALRARALGGLLVRSPPKAQRSPFTRRSTPARSIPSGWAPPTGIATCATRCSSSPPCAPCWSRASATSSRSAPTRSSPSAPRRPSRMHWAIPERRR